MMLKVYDQHKACRQMLGEVLKNARLLGLRRYAGLSKERITEMNAIFSPKAPVGRTGRERARDSRNRAAGVADLKRALNYINEHGIGMKQNEDGTYEQGAEKGDSETLGDEDETSEEGQWTDEEQEEMDMEGLISKEDEQEDVDMVDVTNRARRLKLMSNINEVKRTNAHTGE